MLTTTRLLLLGTALMVACMRDGRPAPAQPAPSVQASRQRSQPATPASPSVQTPRRREQAIGFIDPGARRPERIRDAIAVLHPSPGSEVTGTVRFVDPGGGVGLEMIARVDGLAPGSHAFHVHVYGDCSSPDFMSAGPHFHFRGSSFDREVGIITGNLGDLTPRNGEQVEERAVIAGAKLTGPFSIIGRSVVVHAQPNDPRITPDGGAGDRIACGVIGVGQAIEIEERPIATTRR